MRLRLNISSKLWLGFGLLLGSIFITGTITYSTLVKSATLSNRINEVAYPSVSLLKELKSQMNQAEKLISVWINNSSEEIPQKSQLHLLHNDEYPFLHKELQGIAVNWTPKNQVLLDTLFVQIDSILKDQHAVMLKFDEKETYVLPGAEAELKVLENAYSYGKYFDKMANLNYLTDQLIKSQEEETQQLSQEIQNIFSRLQQYVLYLGLFFFTAGIIIAYLVTKSIVRPINKLKELLKTMGQGVLPNAKLEARDDEIGKINIALMNLINGLKSIVSFSKSVGTGNLETDFVPLSDKDDLGNNLLLMRNNLKKVTEDDYKRNWSTAGLAKFSELLRVSSENVASLSENLIVELVRYLKANQGAIFVINNADPAIPYLELKGCYAWDRQKFLDQKVYPGDGLIGQCWQERDAIYITDIPSNYIHITSGLGKALPKSILIVPMVANNEVFGVMEIASFHLMQEHEIEFVRQLAASTATTISSTKVNEQTKLLLEKAQISSEKLKAQEEEMRQKQLEMDKNQNQLSKEISLLKKQLTELKHKNERLRDENEVMQNLVLRLKKDIQ
jgi:GAF domain